MCDAMVEYGKCLAIQAGYSYINANEPISCAAFLIVLDNKLNAADRMRRLQGKIRQVVSEFVNIACWQAMNK